MCGIAGVIGGVRDGEDVRNMIHAIKHRGPDDQGFFAMDDLSLGMCRLSILDLSAAGHQPMTSSDGRCTVVFNGEIYNFRELRDELARFGTNFRGNSDTEVVVEAFARWGPEAVSRFRGMWALAVFSRERRELFLARDPFGIKPLYFYDDGALRAFSSEIKGLLAHPSVSRALDAVAVHDILLLGYPLAPRTILKHARALLPGEEVVLNVADGARTSRIVPLVFDEQRAIRPPTDGELFSALEDSVRHHLIADVPVGLFYSGGLDSSVLAAVLKRAGADLTAYHVAVEGRPDTPYARKIAAALGVHMVDVPFAASDVPRLLEHFWKAMDQPLADTGLFPTLLVAERAVQDVKVVLAGEGGDELFAGYDRVRRMQKISAPWVHDVVHETTKGWRVQNPALFRRVAVWRRDLVGSFLAETSLSFGLVDEARARETIASRLCGRETPDGPLAPDRLIYLPDDLLAKADVATMAASLEARVPFLDRDVFKLVAAAPMSWKRAGSRSKAPLRRVLESVGVPRDLLDRSKAGFSVPLTAYLLNHERDRIHEAIEWYLAEFSEAEPALATAFRRGLSSESHYDHLQRTCGYTLYALLTVYQFAHH